MNENIPPSQKTLKEALDLSEEILKNIELSEFPLTNICLKASRLARLLNDFDYQKIMEYEASGYPTTPTGVPPEIYQLGALANREYQDREIKTSEIKNYIYLESVEVLEKEISTAELALNSARDPDVSVSSANPNQFVWNPGGNTLERKGIRSNLITSTKRLSNRRAFIHSYVVRKYNELKYSGIADDVFSQIRERVDADIGEFVPDAVKKFTAVYENLKSENSEDWSNAVHSCRRILQDLADAIYPPGEDKTIKVDGKDQEVKLGKENFINRLMFFIEEKSTSERFQELVGSHLRFIGERLDSIFKATQKGSHASVDKKEADRYVVYTYMIVGDILGLLK